MKKFLLTLIVCLFASFGFISCSHEFEFYSKQQIKENEYATAFEKSFGKVGSNVDWGFVTKNNNTRSISYYALYKGNIQPTISFPSDCSSDKFLASEPSGVNALPTWGGGAGNYLVEGEYQTVTTWAGASKIYIKGMVDLSANDTNNDAPRFAPDYRSEIFLLEGATLKLGQVSALNFKGTIYIANGASLVTDGHLKVNGESKVYNHGNITAGTFEVNTSSFLYNVGTLTVTNINVESNNSRIVNDATINSTNSTIKAGAVQNNDAWNVTGTTRVESNNSGWVNNGHWTTTNYSYVGGSWNVINNCFLEVSNDFEMNVSSVQGAFKIDSGGGVLTNNFYGGRDSSTGATSGPFVVTMGANAVFVVRQNAKLESGRYDEQGFGFFGPKSGGYAVLSAKNIIRDSYLESINSHGAVTYGGHLYVSAERHFAQGMDSDGSGSYVPQPFIYGKDGFNVNENIYASNFNSGKPNINIPQSPCSPGFQGGSPVYRVIAEDLSASEEGDFDFNDVVFDVLKSENGVTSLKLICAGGVLPLKVMGIEIHGLFGETTPDANGNYKMYNTGAGPNVSPVTFTINGTYTTREDINKIKIEVFKEDEWMELKATRGKAACKILVDNSFEPVAEKRNIANEYQEFTNYVQGKFIDNFWWKKD